jgi:hypothetical protein
MSEVTIRVPAAVAGDPSDVSTALEVAGALWEKGSREDAIRWVKRAVEAASGAGAEARAAALSAAVAELERAAERPSEAGPPASIDDAEVEPVTSAPEIPGAPAIPAAPSAASAPPPVPSAPPSAPSAAPQAASHSASKPPPVPAAAHATSASRPPARPASVAARAPSTPAGAPPSARPRVGAAPGASATVAAPLPPPVKLPVGQRIRVSVKTSVRDPSLLVVRPLAEGRPLPPGTREGTLVLSEDTAEDARGHTNGSATS